MKPSERIKQIMKRMAEEAGDSPFDHKTGAVWEYLDEEKERVNEVLHEIVIVRELPIAGTATEVYLHAMIDEKLVDPIVGNNNESNHG